ncbi:MAG: sugar ABC transporter substrate-binding protein [bacterium]|nr:sugar ABC transporter substrate-binding protein [bacterium]
MPDLKDARFHRPLRPAIGVLAVSLAVLGLAMAETSLSSGCAKQDASETRETHKPRIALVMTPPANEFFKTMEDGARAHQGRNAQAYDLVANGIKDEQDVSRQIDLVEQMIAQRVDAIILAPADSKALVPVCKKAMEAGIVVVNIDNQLDAAVKTDQGVRIPFVGPDNRKGAALAGEFLAKILRAGNRVALIGGIPNAFNAVQRRLGFEDAMKAHGIEIVASQSAEWEMDRANQVASAMITAHPEIKAILCANDSMALGACSALRAVHKDGAVQVVGFDNISAVQQLLREGKILCTVDQHADQLAVFGIEYALKMLRTGTTPADQQTPVDLITRESLAKPSEGAAPATGS